jgi:hypothetical protein
MNTIMHSVVKTLTIVATAALFAACADKTPLAPDQRTAMSTQLSAPAVADKYGNDHGDNDDRDNALETLRRVTARYHDLRAATNDGFVLLHDCETRGNEGPVGTVYYNPTRLADGIINPEKPDALIYEPGRHGGPLTLVGVEFAIPFTLWDKPQPPTFHGATFQREDEFGVFGLLIWIWRSNPNGLFAESNPRVSCGS